MCIHYLKLLTFSLIVLLSGISANAGKHSVETAKEIACAFFSDGNYMRLSDRSAMKHVKTATNSAGELLYYVFNATDGHGFAIIAADDDAAYPVIGYSYESTYEVDNVPAQAESMLKEASAARAWSATKGPVKSARYTEGRERKELNTALWSQEAPFNNLIPGRKLTGCVGIAMASIMKYHNWPEQGNGSLGDVDFNVAYDWDNMRTDNYRNGYSDAEATAVATLVSHAAQSIKTDFGMSSSSAFEVRVPVALINYFGYDAGVSYKKRAEIDKEAWDEILLDEIDANRPVLYSGQDLSAGHAFVCDGYEVRAGAPYFHINWGWGGLANGYFASDALNPQASRSYSFNDQTTIVYNIKPANSIVEWSPIHLTADEHQIGMTADVTDLAPATEFTVRAGAFKNVSYDDFSGEIAVALYSQAGAFKALLSDSRRMNLATLQILTPLFLDFKCAVPSTTTVDDTDVVRLVTRANGSQAYLPVAGDLLTASEISAKAYTIPYFAINMPASVDGTTIEYADDKVIKGRDYTFRVTPDEADKVVTVKANGFILTPGADYTYRISNVNSDQQIGITVQNASDVVAKRSLWVSAGELESLINDTDAGTITDLTLYGTIDVNDFSFMRNRMKLSRLDISQATIVANGSNPSNAIPAKAFSGYRSLKQILLPANLKTFKSGCFNATGLETIEIPASVATYEYNIFLNCTMLREVTVRRSSPAWVNWCVFTGTPKARLVVPVGSEAAYRAKENWQDFKEIVEKNPEPVNYYTVTLQETAGVKITPLSEGTEVAPGTVFSFTVETDDSFGDASMMVFANSSRLYPDANGVYSAKISANTLIHTQFKQPIPTTHESPWKITGANGGVGLATEVVNVVPSKNFTIRANALAISANDAAMFYAAVLTDAEGAIKEIISPITANYSTNYGNLPCNFTCQVKEASVREGNFIRIATSYNQKSWQLVAAEDENVCDRIKAVGNEVVYHTVTMPESVKGATIQGGVSQVVRGMPLSIKVTPVSEADRITVAVNGINKIVDAYVATLNIPSVTEDLDITIQVNPAGSDAYTVVNVKPGELVAKIEQCPARLKIVGEMSSADFDALRAHAGTIKDLDMADVNIVDKGSLSSSIPSNAFASSNPATQTALTAIILPTTLTGIEDNAFARCGSITEITIPENVGYIGNGAFSACISLNKLIVRNPTPAPLNMNPFPANAANITLEVPKGSESAYASATFWKDLKMTTSIVTFNIQIDPTRTFNYNTYFELSNVPYPENSAYTLTLGLPNYVPSKYTNSDIYRPGIAFKLYNNDVDDTYNVKDYGQYFVKFDKSYQPNTLPYPQDHVIEIVFYYGIKFNVPENASVNFSPDQDDVWKNVNMSIYDPNSSEKPTLYREGGNYTFTLSGGSENMDAKVSMTKTVIVTPGQYNVDPVISTTTQVIIPDENGVYTIGALDGNTVIDVTMVPNEGATLDGNDILDIDPESAAGVTSIALSGDLSEDVFNTIRDKFPNLETIDLSQMENVSIPDDAFSGMSNLVSVSIPENVTSIGQNAFYGCSSLESITLGNVTEIGSNAFFGCENLTSINLRNDDAGAASAQRRGPASRMPGIDDDSFEGINPNCLIFVTAPIATISDKHNVVCNSSANGVGSRLAITDINLSADHLFNSPASFNLGEKSISITIPVSHKNSAIKGNWTGIVLPFAPALISSETTAYTIGSEGENTMDVYAFGTETDESLTPAQSIAPNTPCVVRINDEADEASEITFSASGIGAEFSESGPFDVPATPFEEYIASVGKDFTMIGCYEFHEADSSDYLLDENGYAFNLVGETEDAELTLAVKPFNVYLKANTETAPESFIILEDTTSGIDSVTSVTTEGGITLTRDGNMLIIHSKNERRLDIYNVMGQKVASMSLAAGKNSIDLPNGIYIIDGLKIKM